MSVDERIDLRARDASERIHAQRLDTLLHGTPPNWLRLARGIRDRGEFEPDLDPWQRRLLVDYDAAKAAAGKATRANVE